MNTATSEDILDLLQKSPPLTVAELSRRLNRTKADIRYHLKILTGEEKVQVVSPLSPSAHPGGGRPAARYTLSDRHTPNNLEELLETLLSIHPLDDSLVKKLADGLVQTANQPNPLPASFHQRLYQIMLFLNERNYQAKWEITKNGPCIRFQTCPYKQLLGKYPQLCQVDRLLIEGLTAQPVQTASTIRDQNTTCTFLLDKMKFI